MTARVLLGLLGRVAALLAFILSNWPWALLAAFLISPEGPHLRLAYKFYGSYSRPYGHHDCRYLGSRGVFVLQSGHIEGCPVIAWLDAREARQ